MNDLAHTSASIARMNGVEEGGNVRECRGLYHRSELFPEGKS